MKKSVLLFFLLFLPLHYVFGLFQRIDGIEEAYIKRVTISFLEAERMYVASRNTLLESRDQGKTFKKLCVFKDEEITHLFLDPSLANTAYLSTTRHLYKITDKIEKIFTSPEEATIFTAAKYKGQLYIGTSKGLYFANEDILNWQNAKGLGEIAIYSIDSDKENLYLAASNGVYTGKEDTFKRIFVIREKEETGEESSGIIINIVKIDVFAEKTLWLGTSKGLYTSADGGANWKKFYLEGIDNVSIYSITQTELESSSLYLGTAKGFFRVDTKKKIAQSLHEGIYGQEILWAEISSQGEAYLATSKGLFKNAYFASSLRGKDIKEILKEEPAIAEIQQAALKYNEVHPDKIRRWRNALKMRALFPTVSWDYDKTVDIYQSATTTRVVSGPRDWGLSFSWDMGNFIWNSYEDDVDTRSRLNTQLRLDILDEINRVYFERLRLKRELLSSTFSGEELFQKELRLEELTAILNGYTGGYFSKKAKELNER